MSEEGDEGSGAVNEGDIRTLDFVADFSRYERFRKTFNNEVFSRSDILNSMFEKFSSSDSFVVMSSVFARNKEGFENFKDWVFSKIVRSAYLFYLFDVLSKIDDDELANFDLKISDEKIEFYIAFSFQILGDSLFSPLLNTGSGSDLDSWVSGFLKSVVTDEVSEEGHVVPEGEGEVVSNPLTVRSLFNEFVELLDENTGLHLRLGEMNRLVSNLRKEIVLIGSEKDMLLESVDESLDVHDKFADELSELTYIRKQAEAWFDSSWGSNIDLRKHIDLLSASRTRLVALNAMLRESISSLIKENSRLKADNEELISSDKKLKADYIELSSRFDDVVRKVEDLKKYSLRDSLTGVYSGAYLKSPVFFKYLLDTVGLGFSLDVVTFDVMNFKSVNDTYGHLSGDDVLRAVFSIISETIRDIDCLVRTGGDEGVVVLANSVNGFDSIIDRIKRKFTGFRFELPDRNISFEELGFGIRFGLAPYLNPEENGGVYNLLKFIKHVLDSPRGEVFFSSEGFIILKKFYTDFFAPLFEKRLGYADDDMREVKPRREKPFALGEEKFVIGRRPGGRDFTEPSLPPLRVSESRRGGGLDTKDMASDLKDALRSRGVCFEE